MKKLLFLAVLTMMATTMFAQSKSDELKSELKKFKDANALVEKYLIKFDTLDFTVFSNQEWARLHESHAKNIIVYWPDGHTTKGIDVHIADLKQLFVYAPDTRIKEHPIRFGSGNFTAVTGVFEGTFTKPMPIGNGKFIQPTGKAFKMPMATIGIWKDGVMIEEHLFWDNKTYMDQIGLGK
ncbi:MAG: ester cyclase [Bacteroidota bacterium]|nr:ester cyclase [Bacteroidota bacterium]